MGGPPHCAGCFTVTSVCLQTSGEASGFGAGGSPDEAPAISKRRQIPSAIVTLLYKMQDEYIIHIGNFDRSDLIS